MSRAEKDAIVAFVNSFKLSKPVADFAQLSEGKALMEVMESVDATHFKNNVRVVASSGPSSDNWVLRMNTLKRLYRLLLSFPLPSPHPSTLSLSSLSEPAFSTIAKSPTSRDGSRGLIQICRFCLATGVWAPGNEKVILQIQRLKEEHMAELMKSIEEVMASLPLEHQFAQGGSSPLKPSPDMSYSPPSSGMRIERDKLLQENDDLRTRCEQMTNQISELITKLEEAKDERDNVAERFANSSGDGNGARGRENLGTGDADRLKMDLIKMEEDLAEMEEELTKRASTVSDLTKQLEDYKVQANEAARLKDELDEYRHTSERLRKSENVIEKYRKKLEESAGLRRELRNLEEENATLVNTNSALEADLKKASGSRSLLDNYKAQVDILEKQTSSQATEIIELNHQLELTQSQFGTLHQQLEQYQEELQVSQDRLKEIELSGGATAGGVKREESQGVEELSFSLDEEIGEVVGGDTKTDLRLKIKALERELSDLRQSSPPSHHLITPKSLLEDANRARDRYQGEFIRVHRDSLKSQAALEAIRSGKGGDNAQTMAALEQRLDEVSDERNKLLMEKQELDLSKNDIEKALKDAKTDLNLVGKDQREILASLRKSVEKDAFALKNEVIELRGQISLLQDKDRENLEQTKKLLMDKIDLQTAGIDQREKALQREQDLNDLRASMVAQGVPPETQQRLLDLHEKNLALSSVVDELKERSETLPVSSSGIDHDAFEQARMSYETQITTLQSELARLKQSKTTLQSHHKMEQQLMLSAWHDLGQRVVRDHLQSASAGSRKRSQGKPPAVGWLGRQRMIQEGASFARG